MAVATTGRWKAYPAYRDSGVEWLGEIPAHWELRRLSSTVTACENGVWGDEPGDSSDDIVCVRVADFDRVRLRVSGEALTTRSVKPEQRARRLLAPGDLLLEKSGGGDLQPVGRVVLFDRDEAAVCSNFIARMPIAAGHDPTFLCYLHGALYSARVNVRSIKQNTGIQNLDSDSYLSEPVALPGQGEQKQIAGFLDRETAKIDALIEKKQRLIGLLDEKRAALISQVVTRGLNPGIPMNRSGVEWLGDIPAHWEVFATRRLATRIEQGWSPVADDRVASDDEWAVIKLSAVSRGVFRADENKALPPEVSPLRQYEIRSGDFLITRSNTPELVGDVCVVDGVRPRLMLCDLVYRVSFEADRADLRFLSYWFLSRIGRYQITRDARGSSRSMVKVSQGHIRSWLVALPPCGEQADIVEFLDRETAKIDALVAKIRQHIERLREYRTALISAVVTGKIDVRDEVEAA